MSSFETCLDNLDFNFSFIGVSETWLTEHNCNLYGLPGYHFAEMHRSTRSGVGVGIFIRENINFQLRPDFSKIDEFCEIVTVEVDKEYFKKEKNIIINVLYRPPGTDLLSFNEYWSSYLIL